MRITLHCRCGEEHEVDASPTDEPERERRLHAAAEWSDEHSGDGHGVWFDLPGVARGGLAREERTEQ